MVIAPGQLILLYSDGLIEAHNAQREMFGFPRLAELVRVELEADKLARRILQALQEFTGTDQVQEDDVTLVTLSRVAPP